MQQKIKVYIANAIGLTIDEVDAEFVDGCVRINNFTIPEHAPKNPLWSYHTTYDKARDCLIEYCQNRLDALKKSQEVWEEKIENLKKDAPK